MKKIFLIIFLSIFFIFPKNIFANSWTLVEIDESNEKSLTEFILKRKDRIEEILNNSNNSVENQYNQINDSINSKKNNSEISAEVIKDLQNQFENLNKSILEKNREIEELTAKDSEKIRKEISEIEKQKIELEKKILVEKNKILALEWEISELEIYKKRYEQLVKENKEEQIRQRETNLAIYIWIFLVYLIISWIWLRVIKNSQKKSIFNVVSMAFFITSIVIFTLVVNPGFVIIFIIIAWSMVLAFKDFIVSFIASLLILKRYKIWDYVEIEWRKWTINSISALNTTLLTETWEIFLLNNFLISKPLKFVESEKEISKVKIIIQKNEVKEKIEKIKNIFENNDVKFSFTEKEEQKIEMEIEIEWINITEKIERIFN